MALGLNTESGNFEARPFIKYDAKAGRMFRVDRVQGAAGWESQSDDITNGFAAVFDFERIEVGWMEFTATGPKHALVPLGQPLPAKPAETSKQGFRLPVYNKNLLGEVAREFSSTAKAVLAAVDQLHTAYEAAPERRNGLLPVVQMTGVQVVETQSKMGTNRNYAPVFTITQWVPRPPALQVAQKPTASAAPPAQQEAPKGATPVGPPPAQPAAQPAPAFDPNNFG